MASPTKAFDRSSRPRTRLDESGAAICNSHRFDRPQPYYKYKGLNARRQVAIFTHLELYMVSLNLPFCTTTFHLSFSLLQMTIVLHPSRIRHNGDTGADVQQGPAQRFLFRLRPCVNLFYCLLLFTSSGYSIQPRRMLVLLAFRHVRILHVAGHSGFIIKGIVQPGICYKDRIP